MICSNCGAHSDGSTRYCVQCGSTVTPQNQEQQNQQYQNQQQPQQQQPQYQQSGGYPPPPPMPYGSPQPPYINQGAGSYAERLHSYGRSGAFLVGVILFTVGSVFSLFINFTVFNIISLLLLSLPVIAGFLIYAASTSPRLPEKILPAMTLYKVSTIIELVLYCIVMAVVIIALIILSAAGGFYDAALGAVIVVIALLVIGIFVLFLVLYYVSILRIVNGIKNGIMSNMFAPLRGVTPLMVIVVIMAAFSLIGSIIMIGASGFYGEFINEIYRELRWEFGPDAASVFMDFIPTIGTGALTASMFFNIATYVGMIMCISVVSKFNNTLRYGSGGGYHGASPPPPHQQQPPRSQW